MAKTVTLNAARADLAASLTLAAMDATADKVAATEDEGRNRQKKYKNKYGALLDAALYILVFFTF